MVTHSIKQSYKGTVTYVQLTYIWFIINWWYMKKNFNKSCLERKWSFKMERTRVKEVKLEQQSNNKSREPKRNT